MNKQFVAPAKSKHEWSRDALLTKAQRMFEEMLQYGHEDWRCALWSALALEVLARAALSAISPVLLAAESKASDSKAKADNLIYALGFTPRAQKFIPRSIEVSVVFERLNELVPAFTEELAGFAISHLHRRNQELHSGNPSFDGLGPASWLPKYYRVCTVLIESMGHKLDVLVGVEEATAARALIAASLDESAKSVGQAIDSHKQKWADTEPEERKTLAKQAKVWASRRLGHRVKCPACGTTGLVTGEPISGANKTIDEDFIIETQKHLPSRFECIACGLKISGLPQLVHAGLGDSYTSTSTYEAADYYRSPYDEFEDDNNEY
jgi:hypothetical protein